LSRSESGAGECDELELGRYRVRFLLNRDAEVFTSLARLLQRVRDWRASEVYEGDQLVSSYHAREMAWCASFQLSTFGECRERFEWGVLPRCALCPLFDSERALRAGTRREPVPGEHLQVGFRGDDAELNPEPDFTLVTNLDFLFDSDLMTQLDGELPEWMNLSPLIPDFPPEEWPDTAPDADAYDDA
jgi:hypothetical protein